MELKEHKLKERMCLKSVSSTLTYQSPSTSAESTPYRTTQAIGKAVKTVQLSLPASPSRRRCVVLSPATKVELTVQGSQVQRKDDNPVFTYPSPMIILVHTTQDIHPNSTMDSTTFLKNKYSL